MQKLKYETRGKISARGLQKVYISCHHSDRDVYLEQIISETLAVGNFSVWYAEKYLSFDFAEKEMQLREMQMVIFLVSKTCMEDDAVLKEEITLCNKYRIPILPIIVEKNVEDVLEGFGERFGDTQYLHFHQLSDTEIDFKDKFKKRLLAICVGGYLKERIQEAFDAIVFLSYRKKDRMDANNLMNLIHEKEEYRGIGFWYDEFLEIGEDFKEGINDAILKCDFCMLNVTPNIMEPGNFVMETELPFVRDEAKKMILPVEMKAVNQEMFHREFAGIPKCIACDDKEAIYATVDSMLYLLGIEIKEHTLERDYYIGLAYLEGICVKPDKIRGAELIRRVAMQNYPEAIHKMFELYKYGNGVARNIKEGIRWKERYVDLCRKGEVPGKSEWSKIYFELWYLAEEYIEVSMLSEAKNCYMEMLELVRGAKESYIGQNALNYIYVYDMLGDLALNVQNTEEALGWFLKSEQLYQEIQRRFDYANNAEGELFCIEALSLGTQVANMKSAMVVVYQRLGTLYSRLGDADKARLYFKKYENIVCGKYEKTETVENKRELMLSYTNEAFVQEKSRDYEGACKNYEKARRICEELATYNKNKDCLRDKAAIAFSWGRSEYLQGYTERGAYRIEEAVRLAMEIVLTYGTTDVWEMLMKGFFLMDSMQRENESIQYQYASLVQIYQFCDWYRRNINADNASTVFAFLETQCSLWDNYIKRSQQQNKFLLNAWSFYSNACYMLGDSYHSVDKNRAKECYYAQLEADKVVFRMRGSKENYENIATSHYLIAQCASGMERDSHLAYACEIFMKLLAEYPQDEHYMEMLREVTTFGKASD